MSQEYAKEIDILNSQLKEANQTIEAESRNRIKMQENLKKAFMRGVCALNLEAMNALNPAAGMDFFGPELTEAEVPSTMRMPSFTESQTIPENHTDPSTTIMVNMPKVESKDHMWKPAPILAKDFSNATVIRPPMTKPEPAFMDRITQVPILRADPMFDNKRDVIVAEGEQEIKCERIPYEGNEMEGGIETRSFGIMKQSVNMYQPPEMPMPEAKVIRVNKYGKSYADIGGNATVKPQLNKKNAKPSFKK